MLKIQKHYEEYINDIECENFHPELKKIFDNFPDKIEDFKNVIFYGKSGIGKYSQMLLSIKKYSSSSLKYDKKMCIVINDKKKSNYFIRISDIHYEVDMSLLSCNAKTLWNNIYYQICDTVKMKTNSKNGIIVCKNFHMIHNELLDVFYSYMNNNTYLKFIILTEHLSFIPDNIFNSSLLINVKVPSISIKPTCIKSSNALSSFVKRSTNKKNNKETINLKDPFGEYKELLEPYKILCNKIIKIITTDNVDFLKLREYIYNFFILHYDVFECIWYILSYLLTYGFINNNDIFTILEKQYEFYYLYNNNYRPIYHIEKFILTIRSIVRKEK